MSKNNSNQINKIKINKDWFIKISDKLSAGLIEREYTIKIILLAIIAQENIFLVGEPGVAKSLLASRFKNIMKDENSSNGKQSKPFFRTLMHQFSTPENISGSLILKKLEEGNYEYKTDGYLPTVKLAFLDEIFKASPILLNTLLTIMNEKIFFNGSEQIKVPLKSLIGASNEAPHTAGNNSQYSEINVDALWDRFLVRMTIDPVTQHNFKDYLTSPEVTEDVNIDEDDKLTDQDFSDAKEAINNINVTDEVLELITTLRPYFRNNSTQGDGCSDRRWRKILKLLKASAYINDRDTVDFMDCFLMAYMLVDNLNEQDKVTAKLSDFIRNIAHTQKIKNLKTDINFDNINDKVDDYKNSIESTLKLIEKENFIGNFEVSIIEKDGIKFYEIDEINHHNTQVSAISKDYIDANIYISIDGNGKWSYKVKSVDQGFNNGYNVKFINNTGNITPLRIYLVNNAPILSISIYHNYNNNSYDINFKTVDNIKAFNIIQKAVRLLSALDNKFSEINRLIKEKIQIVSEIKTSLFKDYNLNIFKNDTFLPILATNIDKLTTELEKIINEIESDKSKYSDKSEHFNKKLKELE